MKKITMLLGLFLGAGTLFAAPASVTYTEGDARIQTKAGKVQDAEIGDVMNAGDTLRTGADGASELDQKGVTIKVAPKTVFTLMERESGGKTTGVLSVALGSIKFRYGKLTGAEPMVRTNGAVAGVRGTEFTVFSGADGSTLIAVESGLVTVESEGKTVDLGPKEGVEVPLGQPPGDKFVVDRTLVDYKTWNEGKLDSMLTGPSAAMTNLETALAGYVATIKELNSLLSEYMQNLDKERNNMAAITKEKGAEEGAKYQKEVVFPLMLKTSGLSMNLAYSTVGALSLRRFVAGRMYIAMKTRYISEAGNADWDAFLSRYQSLLSTFEKEVVPHLTPFNI
jgi:hypothetical protein